MPLLHGYMCSRYRWCGVFKFSSQLEVLRCNICDINTWHCIHVTLVPSSLHVASMCSCNVTPDLHFQPLIFLTYTLHRGHFSASWMISVFFWYSRRSRSALLQDGVDDVSVLATVPHWLQDLHMLTIMFLRSLQWFTRLLVAREVQVLCIGGGYVFLNTGVVG